MNNPSSPIHFDTNAHGLGVAHFAASMGTSGAVVLVAPDAARAEALLQDCRFLLGDEHEENVLFLPAHDKTPYHLSSPDPVLVMERMATLFKLANKTPFKILVTSPDALVTKTIPLDTLQKAGELVVRGSDVDRDELIRKLNAGGYNKVNAVEDAGTYAIRGSIIDIFWPGQKEPVRIDLFGDTVERIHSFNPQTQRTTELLESFCFGPVKEVWLDEESVQRAEKQLTDLADEIEYPTKKLRDKLHDLENRIPFFGIESLLPAFYENIQSPMELLQRLDGKEPTRFVYVDFASIKNRVIELSQEFDTHYGTALARGELCFAPKMYLAKLDAVEPEAVEITARPTDTLRQDILKETLRKDDITESAHSLLAPLAKQIRQLHQDRQIVLLPVASLGGTHRLRELLQPNGVMVQALKAAPQIPLPPLAKGEIFNQAVHAFTYVAIPEPPSCGAHFRDLGITVFAEDEIFGKRSRRQGQAGKKSGFKTTLSDLDVNDPIVHVDHGVGLFKGLTRLNVRGVEQDFLLLTYAGEDKLYLPVHRINLIQPYSGVEGQTPRLDKLGGLGWQSKKKKVKEAVLAMAQDLLNLYAKRELAKRPIYRSPEGSYFEFEGRFPFETTPDQQKAIDDVLGDMQKERPMDRLICGDVGYGKTEVAMRAAMMAVNSGRQVAILAPTTVLAQQHGITFTERFSETGAQVGVVSRFQSKKEVSESIKRAKDGKLDILIGTHRLLSPDVSFKNLGLVIVDEEQRFGIKAKEHLKRLRTQSDVITMSATPIPRTLQMGFFGIRDLSIIETPPVDRRAIRTTIAPFDDEVIREAILRELGRGGQVYFVHNRVTSINAKADYLRRLVPEAKIEIGHGQMEESKLEDVMVRFMKHEFNVLVCTTIIETGIDVASANTMFIDHADDFGLAQLYQLRGRVGRSKERAFAYLLVESSTDNLTPIARKRLEILHRFSELGAGFRIAQHDLELRGAGDLLGKNQHGHVAAVGYDLYADLLKDAVEELRGRTHEDVPDPDISLPIAALIPDKYIVDLHERLGFYQRLATAQGTTEIFDVVGAMGEQFGDPPPEVLALAEVMALKQLLRQLATRGLECNFPKPQEPKVALALGNQARLDPLKLTEWVKANPWMLQLTPQMKLVYTPSDLEWKKICGEDVFMLCKHVLRQVKENAS